MNTILEEINRALDFGLFYLAIVSALTVPDICAALESEKGKATERGYREWCKRWFLDSSYRRHLTDLDLWRLRSGIIHQGRMGHPGMEFARVIFSLPTGFIVDLNWLKDPQYPNDPKKRCLNLDTRRFVRTMIKAAINWSTANQNNALVQEHLKNLVQYRAYGLLPWLDQKIPVVS